ncbi:MAG TPA: PH domain-containing protein [Candidatus Ornithoclostridium faecavium]|nr:PH domain-containing protein [Candidatus Ornithoclostridium faecavium]
MVKKKKNAADDTEADASSFLCDKEFDDEEEIFIDDDPRLDETLMSGDETAIKHVVDVYNGLDCVYGEYYRSYNSSFLKFLIRFIPLLILVGFAAFGGLLIYFCIQRGIFGENLSVLTFLLGAFLLVFFLPVYAWFFECFTAYVQYRHAEYVLTDRRVIAKKWRWGRYLEIADYKKIITINHVLKRAGKPFKAGDVVISLKKIVLKALADPADTARELRKIVKSAKEGKGVS